MLEDDIALLLVDHAEAAVAEAADVLLCDREAVSVVLTSQCTGVLRAANSLGRRPFGILNVLSNKAVESRTQVLWYVI